MFIILELSENDEAILVMENISPLGFRNGPRLELDEDHLFSMTKLIAQYHSFSYATKITTNTDYNRLVKGIIPFPFQPETGKKNVYHAIYTVGVRRFLDYFETVKGSHSEQLQNELSKMKAKYGANPVAIMDSFLVEDKTFSVILHGDYNRNNVLFKYDSTEGFDKPRDIKTIDFQVSVNL